MYRGVEHSAKLALEEAKGSGKGKGSGGAMDKNAIKSVRRAKSRLVSARTSI